MIWLELRNDKKQFDQGWNFTESAWAPYKKEDGSDWPFWYLIGKVSKDDLIIHLRNIKGKRSFVGYSVAACDGYVTNQKPTSDSHEWDFSESFFKVDLKDFQSLDPSKTLSDFFNVNESNLREIFLRNKSDERKMRLFYVIQNNRLQCLNGAYFSEFSKPLNELLLKDISEVGAPNVNKRTETGEIYKRLKQRIGHLEFSENVKGNYNYQCCFPQCEIKGKGFLVSGHISRWTDNETSRGETDNGLCFCLIHDKAFENGFFIVDEDYKIKIVFKNISEDHQWIIPDLQKGMGAKIKARQIDPNLDYLRDHWSRIGYSPQQLDMNK